MNKSIEKAFDQIRKAQCSRLRYIDQRDLILKELTKLYNRGVGVGKRCHILFTEREKDVITCSLNIMLRGNNSLPLLLEINTLIEKVESTENKANNFSESIIPE